jgi:hypothetical protein
VFIPCTERTPPETTPKISHRTRGYYFRLQDLLYDGGSYTFQSGIRSWPFSFTIPIEAESADPRVQRPSAKRELDKIGMLRKHDLEGLESDHFSSNPTWRGSYDNFRGRPDPHRLPDTFEYVSNRFPASCEARVEYELTATLKRPTRGVLFPAKDIEASRYIVLRSRNHAQDHRHGASPEISRIVDMDANFAVSQLTFNHGSKRSLLETAAMNIFRPGDMPKLIVTISAVFNRQLRPGNICAFLLRASNAANSDLAEQSSMPPIKLRSYTLYLVARTALRAKLEAVMVQDVNHHAIERRVLLSGKGLDMDVPRCEDRAAVETPTLDISTESPPDGFLRLSSGPLTDESDRRFMIPTFKTYNINREYTLALEMKLECAGAKYDLKRENIEVVILAEEDDVEPGKLEQVQDSGKATEQTGVSHSDSKGTLKSQDSADEKQGPMPPPPREAEVEELPQYEPGDVPVYHAGDQSA